MTKCAAHTVCIVLVAAAAAADQQLRPSRAPQPPQPGVLELPALLRIWPGGCLVLARQALYSAAIDGGI